MSISVDNKKGVKLGIARIPCWFEMSFSNCSANECFEYQNSLYMSLLPFLVLKEVADGLVHHSL